MLSKPNGATIIPPDNSVIPAPLLIKDGRVIDPVNGIDKVMNVIVRDGKINSLTTEMPSNLTGISIIDAKGKWVVPGLTDMHVHLREPGREDK